jgi:DNA repair photolyase
MKLNEAKGNMYDFITHTGNAIKGECPHGCSYCYMKRWGKQSPVHLDEKELKIPMTLDNYIFVGSSCDMFADNIPSEWILKTLEHCCNYRNQYLFQTKNPVRLIEFYNDLPMFSNHCTTLETNRFYRNIMFNCNSPVQRANDFIELNEVSFGRKFITIEPIIDFDLKDFIECYSSIRYSV